MLELLQSHPWFPVLVAALVGVVLAMVVRRVARTALRRLWHGNARVQAILQSTDRPGAAVFPLLALLVVLGDAPANLPFLMTIRHVTSLLLIIGLTWFTVAIIQGFAQGILANNPWTVEDNLHARRVQTQTLVLARSAMVVVVIAGSAMALMTFPSARQVGASLLASAGVLGIIGGIAARPVFANLIAGLQLALAQPIRIDDVLIVKGEWGRVEEITGSYVVLKIWDERRLIIPLQWFIENPFENWTRTGANILGTVFLYLDYATPVQPLRDEAERLVKSFPEWDGRVFAVQVTDITDRAIQVRVLVSAANSGKAFDLRCKLRESLLAFLAREYPQSLPVSRNITEVNGMESVALGSVAAQEVAGASAN